MIISVSLMSADLWNLSKQLHEIKKIKNTWIHVDMMDGYYANNIGFSKKLVDMVNSKTALFTDIHLMVKDPEKYARILCKGATNAITFHTDTSYSQNQNLELMKYIKRHNIRVGVTVQSDQCIEDLFPYLNLADIALVITTKIGFGAQHFCHDALDKITKLYDYRDTNHLHFMIEVDGGINNLNAHLCRKHGADILVSGNYIFSDEKIAEHITILKK